MKHPRRTKIVAVMAIAACILLSNSLSQSASVADFASATNAINVAFVATRSAGQDGGNVSQLVTRLDLALSLVQEAEAENATNPALATSNLQNATQIAEQVNAQASVVAQSGTSARALQIEESIGASAAIVFLAALAYFFGGRVYRRLWLYLHRDFLVRAPHA